jgi:hypothetical protein
MSTLEVARRAIVTERGAAFAAILLRTAICLYRAVHQGITTDEAFNYNRFVEGGWTSVANPFDANNHVLYTALAKLSSSLLGVSEWSLRLPSVIGGALLMWLVFELLLFAPSRWLRWIAFLAIASHPLSMDFSIAARGYSLSICLLLLGVLFVMRGQRPAWASGIALGLAASANLGTVFPGLALIVVVTALSGIRKGLQMFASALAVGAAICCFPLRTATRGSFYLGYPSFSQALESYRFTMLRAKGDAPGFLGNGESARLWSFGFCRSCF